MRLAPRDEAVGPALPTFAPGDSPFHAKGLVWSGACEYFRAAVPGGISAVKDAIASTGDTVLAHFLDGPFVAGGWYDILPIVPISANAARLRGMSHAEFVRSNAAWLAERDLRGVYRVILALASVGMVASRLGNLSMRYFDFGRAESHLVRDGLLESYRYGIPAPLAQWFIFAAEGFVPVALKLAGARNVQLRYSTPRPDGMLSGSPAVQIRFEIQWE